MDQLFKPAQTYSGRVDVAEGVHALRWHQKLYAQSPKANDFALLGFAVDAGVERNQGRVGAQLGPAALRQALANMAWHHGERNVFDAGCVLCPEDQLEAAQAFYGQQMLGLFNRGLRPFGLGGGHEIAYASWLGLAEFAASQQKIPRIGILNFDAHFDLRLDARASSGTPFRQIALDCHARAWPFHYACLGVSQASNTQALFEFAKTQNVWFELDRDLQQLSQTLSARLAQFLNKIDWLYISVCMDVFPAASAPGVSAPAAMGVPPAIVETLIHQASASAELRYADIAELNPRFDIDARTAKLAARMLWNLAMASCLSTALRAT
jgi:formiminoglutamase